MKKWIGWAIVVVVLFNAVVMKNRAAIAICCAVALLLLVGLIAHLLETPEQRAARENKQKEETRAPLETVRVVAQTVERTQEVLSPVVRARAADDILDDVDHMDGIEFESWCAHLLERLGYENVETTVATGDQGVDIIAERKGMKYAIQCKRYNTLLGNSPIQEVYAGMRFYDCRVAVVMTNSRFTKAAWELAEATGVKLWDRYMLKKFLRRLGQS